MAEKYSPREAEYLSRVWFRGHGDASWHLVPKLYRDWEAREAIKEIYGAKGDDKRLNLEREILEEFRNSAVASTDFKDDLEVVFTAQHFGMPTRLLDWSTNPLVAAYFAVTDQPEEDGEILVMDASKVVQEPSDYHNPGPDEEMIGQFVAGTRHPHVKGAINESFWRSSPNKRVIISVRPDAAVGRIGQQSSRFTLHRRNAPPVWNPTMESVKIPKDCKRPILADLKRLNVGHHAIFADLDRLAKGIKEARLWKG